ncbi:MAG: DNA gyrase subunit B [Lentisphaerae bacterium ADurb.Bin242]|nr:MAG: DNA gyrase subunit B [Lentisphaerae bacterium ADurb.Bin242]
MDEKENQIVETPVPAGAVYDESKVKTLSSLEHIRQRPGMYVGRMGDGSHPDDAVYVMLKEVIDNSVDEYIMGYGKRIDVSISDNELAVRDYGRGIPLGKLVECVSQINTGAKYNTDVFQFSVGLNGVGTKAVNALSEKFVVQSIRDGKFKRVEFNTGILCEEEDGVTEERNGTFTCFIPDPKLFPKYAIRQEYVERRLWMYAFLNSGLSLYYNNQRYYSKNGLMDLVNNEVGGESLYEIIHYKDKTLEFALCHTSDFGEKYYSFVNGQFTSDGGTHLSAFKEGVLRAVNEFSGKDYDARDLRDGIVGSIAIKLQDPMFESQTKNKLGNTDIKGWIVGTVKQAVVDYLHRHLDEAELLLNKVKRNQDLRKEISAIQKKGREMSKRMSLRNSKLKDCKHHFSDRSKFAEQTMIFLTEGDSAGGSLEQSRNPMFQAVFSLRGKPLNCFGMKLDSVYTNEEFYYIMHTLDIEEDIDNLRYAKVIIATDADVDGLHIRNLLITFFLSYFEPLVLSGHLYILETPLFRVRNKKETFYCYSEEERDAVAAKLGKGAEITRFKGLGEISPREFGQFIGDDIRLEKVTVEHSKGIGEMLKFYMGDNTPDRWEHIENNLV